jgi:hypothetical protein
MGKIAYWVATMLMSLSVTACSVNAGGGSTGEPIPKQSLSDTDSTNSTDSSSNNSADGGAKDNSSNNGSADNNTNGNSSDNNNAAGSNSGGATTSILTGNPAHITSTSQAYKYLTDESAKQELLNKISTMSNLTGPCTSARGSNCASSLPSGTVVAAYKQSYSNYAIIREPYNADNRVKPANSFVYLVTHATPETNKTAALNATYKGQASYSRNNFPNIVTRNDLILTTTDSTIQGVLNAEPTSRGLVYPVITFNAGQINVSGGNVNFSGNALFHARFFNSSSSGNGNDQDLTGSYAGVFAGSNAEEVVGTFETGNYSDEKAVQGAFIGRKQ